MHLALLAYDGPVLDYSSGRNESWRCLSIDDPKAKCRSTSRGAPVTVQSFIRFCSSPMPLEWRLTSYTHSSNSRLADATSIVVVRGPIPAPPPGKATALAHPARKATADAAPLRSGLARGSLRARLRRRAAAPISGRGRETDDRNLRYDLARIREIKRGLLVRRLAGFHVVVDVRLIEDDAIRLWLDDGSTITLGARASLKWHALSCTRSGGHAIARP